MAVDGQGDVYIADFTNQVIEKVSTAGVLSVVAGNGGHGPLVSGSATQTPLGNAHSYSFLAVDDQGDVYISVEQSNVVAKASPSGVLSIVAGTGKNGEPKLGPATQSPLDYPEGIAVDDHGNLYIADSGNGVVEKVTPSGQLSIMVGIVR